MCCNTQTLCVASVDALCCNTQTLCVATHRRFVLQHTDALCCVCVRVCVCVCVVCVRLCARARACVCICVRRFGVPYFYSTPSRMFPLHVCVHVFSRIYACMSYVYIQCDIWKCQGDLFPMYTLNVTYFQCIHSM